MPGLVAYNPNGIVENALQFGTIVMDVNGSVDLGSLIWCPGFGICNEYIIITDTYTQGRTDQANAQPMGYCTTALTDPALISSINKLAASKSSGPFVTLQDAITWALGQGYFIINQDYPSIVTNGCVLNLDAGLPASYPLVFNNWYDLSGNGNTGTTNNSVTYSYSSYGNLVFSSSSSDYVSFTSTSNIPSGNTNYTISVWFNPSSIGDKGLVGWGNYGSTNEVNAFRLSSTGLINYWWANDLSVNVSLSTSTWYNAVAIFDGTTREIWLNGSSLGSDTPVGHNVTTTSNLTVGKTYNTEYFDGSIGEVQIFNRALSSNEILQSYNALLPRYNDTYVDPCVTPIYPFITTWRTTTSNESITLPYSTIGTYDGTIDWGDGNITSNSYANRTHIYTTPGNYTVTVRGRCVQWSFRTYGGTNTKITGVLRWGSVDLGNTGGYFKNCTLFNLNLVVDILLNLSNKTNFASMFESCSSLTTINRANEWDVSNITDMSYTFFLSSFNGNISNWDVSKVITMAGMFANTPFNQSISNWNVSNVLDMTYTFSNATSYNQNMNNWDVSKVNSMYGTFNSATSFNQPLSGWNVSNVYDMAYTFNNARVFNQNINNWDVSKVYRMYNMFEDAIVFNQPLSGWNVSNVTDMTFMFHNAFQFNQNINNWNVSIVTRMAGLFYNAYRFNQPLSGWNVSQVTRMDSVFQMDNNVSTSFNQPIGNWNVSSVTNMSAMFYNNRTFNQPLSGWTTSSLRDTYYMFRTAIFNQNIGNWDVSKVRDMNNMFLASSSFNNGGSPSISGWTTSALLNTSGMFRLATSFNQPIGTWNTSKVTDMSLMFNSSTSFNQNIGSWNVVAVIDFTGFMQGKTNANYSSANLDAIYNGWSTQNVKTNLSINFGTIKYSSAGAAGKAILTGSPYNWVIVDGGQV